MPGTYKDFTEDIINDDAEVLSILDSIDNWEESVAKELKKTSCKDCRYFSIDCHNYLGKWHKPCNEFSWG